MFSYVSYNPVSHHSAIEKIGEQIFDDPYDFRQALRDASRTSIVALNKRKVVGFALLENTRVFRHLDAIDLTYLAIHPDYQSQGIGSTLLTKVKMMSPNVILHVSYDNPNAERLYRRHGFEPWRALFSKANGGYLMGYSKQQHEQRLRLRGHQSPQLDEITAP